MANIFDLTGTTVAANYRKVSPSTQFGTRELRFVKVELVGGTRPDFTVGTGLSDSYFSKAVLQMQNYGESWAVGTPGQYAFVMVFSSDTAQDSAVDTNAVTVPGTWGDAEAAVYASLGSWASGSVTVKDIYLSGAAFAEVS